MKLTDFLKTHYVVKTIHESKTKIMSFNEEDEKIDYAVSDTNYTYAVHAKSSGYQVITFGDIASLYDYIDDKKEV